MDEENTVQNELLKKITTLKKNDGSIVYPRTVTDAIKDKNGRKLTDVIDDLKEKVEEQSNSIAEVENTIENKLSVRLEKKVDKVEGKDLSTNDFTDELKSLLTVTHEEKIKTMEETIDGELVSNVECSDEKISFYSKNGNAISDLHFLNNDDLESLLGSLDDENN